MPSAIESQETLASAISSVNLRVMSSFAAKQFSELANFYTSEAQVLVARMEPILGRASIAGVFTYMRKHIHTLELATSDVEGEGDTAIEHGLYTHRSIEGEVIDRGKYLVAWKRIQGQWLIHRDMIVSDMTSSGTKR